MTIPTPSAEPEDDVIEELINFHEVRAEDIRFFFRDGMTPEPFPGANDGMREALAMHTDGVAALRRSLERERVLREALEPFNRSADHWWNDPTADDGDTVCLSDARGTLPERCDLSVGDFRRLRTALSNPLKTETAK